MNGELNQIQARPLQALKPNTFAIALLPFGVTSTARVPLIRRTQPASKL